MIYPLIKACFLFPAVHFVLLILGFLIRFYWPKTGNALLWGALVLLFLCSTPFGQRLLAAPLQIYPNFDPSHINPKARAIVVLNSRGTLHEQNLRLAKVSGLHKAYGLPVIVSGKGGAKPLAARLRYLFNTPVAYVDNISLNTWDHATDLAPYLQKNDLQPFYLVASSSHMKRAMWVFEHEGLKPIPLIVTDPPKSPSFDWIPNTRSLTYANYAYYEHVGLLWYRVKAFMEHLQHG